jgi:hypothetical protein
MIDELSREITQTVKEKNPQNVQQLVDIVKARHPFITEKRIFESVLALQKMGELSLKDQTSQPPKYFSENIKTSKFLWYWITLAFSLVTAFTILVAPEYLQIFGILRVFFGASFVFWFPGYSFVKALFPAKSSNSPPTDFETAERIALSLGMSLAIVPIVGLFLYYTPWGISLAPVVLCLVAFTLILSTFSIAREWLSTKQ